MDYAYAKHAVVLYTKPGCAACLRAKKVLNYDSASNTAGFLPQLPISDVKVVELDLSNPVDATIFDHLSTISNKRTVPVIFINHKYVGGGDDLVASGLDNTLLLNLLLASAVTSDSVSSYLNHHKSHQLPPPSPTSAPPLPPTAAPSNSPTPLPWPSIMSEISTLIAGEDDLFANAANISSCIYNAILTHRGPSACNWCGFYFTRTPPSSSPFLLLGPFQGKPACRRIEYHEGVCGAAARTGETQLVHDVHAFPGHIACDSASNSEVSACQTLCQPRCQQRATTMLPYSTRRLYLQGISPTLPVFMREL